MGGAVQDTGMDERLTVAKAAERLEITKEAVPKRIHRGTLRSDKDADGTVRVYVPVSETASETASETPSSTGRDELVSELRNQVSDLREQLEAERRANEENRRLLAALIQRVPELEALQELLDGRKSAGAGSDKAEPREPRSATGDAQEDAESPWWKRVFGK